MSTAPGTRTATPPWEHLLTPEDRLVAARYDGARAFGTRPALLLIDLYVSVFGDRREPLEAALERFPGSCGPAAWDAMEPLERLLGAARAAGIPIAHTTGEGRPESSLGTATRRRQVAGEDGGRYQLHDRFLPREGELLVRKTRASGFFGTPLSTWLRQQDADCLIVGGESTSGCVRASVVDAFSHGFHVAVAQDAVFDRSPLSHAVNLLDMHRKYATVTDVERATTYLAGRDPAVLPRW